ALFISSSRKRLTPNAQGPNCLPSSSSWALSVCFALIDCHVLVVLLQLLSVLSDLNGFRIEDANRYGLTLKFNRNIRRRDPSFKRGLSVIAEGHPHVGSFERLDCDSILFA